MSGNTSTLRRTLSLLVVAMMVAMTILQAPVLVSAHSNTVEWTTSTDWSDWTLNNNTNNGDGTVTLNDSNSQPAFSPVQNISSNEKLTSVSVNVTSIGDGMTLMVTNSTGSQIASKSISTTGTHTLSLNLSKGHEDVKIGLYSTNSSNPATVTSATMNLETNSAPSADFQDSDNTATIVTNESLTLNASSSTDPDGDSLTYKWDMDNDGNYSESTSGGLEQTVSYSSTGTYNVTVKVVDQHGTNDTATFAIEVDPDSDGDGVADSEDDYPLNAPESKIIDESSTKVEDEAYVELVAGSGQVTLTVEAYNNTSGTWEKVGNVTKSAQSDKAVLATVEIPSEYDSSSDYTKFRLTHEGDASVQDVGILYDSSGSGGDVGDTTVVGISLIKFLKLLGVGVVVTIFLDIIGVLELSEMLFDK